MHHYLCYKSDIILSKTDGFSMFLNANVSLSTKRTEHDVISYCGTFRCIRLAQNIFLQSTSKQCFVTIDQRITNCVTFYKYLANIVSSRDLAFNSKKQYRGMPCAQLDSYLTLQSSNK